MCGFLGELAFKGDVTSKSHFMKLLELSVSRGPDDTAYFCDTPYQLGFNRLAILELSPKGRQPMKSPSGRYVVVFNGELYNYRDLTNDYQLSGIDSNSDTQVLVHLLEVLGVEQTLEQLNGMFAIAIADLKDQLLYLARDFAGIKPLFYGMSASGLVFASQFNQLVHHEWLRPYLKLNPSMVKAYFALGYMASPNTIFEGLFQVNPGELVRITKAGVIRKSTFCQFSDTLKSDPIVKDQDFKDVLDAAVKRQLVSDVPIGTFLSGGIDSPLIAAVAKQHHPKIESFTYSAGDHDIDESQLASAYAAHLQLKQQVETLGEEDILESIASHFRGMPEPFGDYSSVPTFVVTKKARPFHTVMLSGDGGDELFFGYPRMHHLWQKRYWFRIPWRIRRPVIRLAIKLNMESTWGPYFYKTWEQWVLSKQQYVSDSYLESMLPHIQYSKELQHLYCYKQPLTSSNTLHWLRYNEFYGHLQRVLTKVDRMSMANSLEVRVPFLDKEVISWAWNHLPIIKGSSFALKEVLKNAMKAYFPEVLISTKKKGFSAPVDDWLKGALKDDLIATVFKTPIFGSEVIKTEELRQYVQDFLDGKHQEAWGVWHVYAWQKWAVKEDFV